LRCRGLSHLELAVVLAVIAVLAALLLQRLNETALDARRVQLRMAAEQLRLQAQLLQLRCADDLACRKRLLSQRRTVPGEAPLAEAPAPASLDPLLVTELQAAGLLALRDGTHTDWTLQPLPGGRLQVALRTHAACALVLERRPDVAGLVVSPQGSAC
jgi:hypothetical protein